jgi:hypothetical protein
MNNFLDPAAVLGSDKRRPRDIFDMGDKQSTIVMARNTKCDEAISFGRN